jgi:hypothetical protein
VNNLFDNDNNNLKKIQVSKTLIKQKYLTEKTKTEILFQSKILIKTSKYYGCFVKIIFHLFKILLPVKKKKMLTLKKKTISFKKLCLSVEFYFFFFSFKYKKPFLFSKFKI